MTAPAELGAREVDGALVLSVRPWLAHPSTGQVARSIAVLGVAGTVFGASQWGVPLLGLLPGGTLLSAVSGGLALLVLGGGGAWLAAASWREARRQDETLDVTVTADTLRLRWGSGAEQRVPLVAIGRVDAVEAGYQRKHVVAQVFGGEPVTVPLERLSDDAVAWFAGRLADAARQAREAASAGGSSPGWASSAGIGAGQHQHERLRGVRETSVHPPWSSRAASASHRSASSIWS
ncbi:MAG: hypothetical protein R3F59_35705 [Myxococcota bacterium]